VVAEKKVSFSYQGMIWRNGDELSYALDGNACYSNHRKMIIADNKYLNEPKDAHWKIEHVGNIRTSITFLKSPRKSIKWEVIMLTLATKSKIYWSTLLIWKRMAPYCVFFNGETFGYLWNTLSSKLKNQNSLLYSARNWISAENMLPFWDILFCKHRKPYFSLQRD